MTQQFRNEVLSLAFDAGQRASEINQTRDFAFEDFDDYYPISGEMRIIQIPHSFFDSCAMPLIVRSVFESMAIRGSIRQNDDDVIGDFHLEITDEYVMEVLSRWK